jgi:MFS family permease
MILFQRYHYHQIDKFFHTDFWLFETSVWLHVFARSMIAIFIPIFLLQMGWSISHVMFFYFIFNVFDAPLNFFAKWLTYKIGARKVIALGTLFYVAFFAVLYNLNVGMWSLLILMALFAAFYDAFYWVAHIYFFMRCEKNDRNISKGVSLLYIVKKIAGILAPIFGALILIFFDKQLLIGLSMIFLLLSIVPLFKIKDTRDRPDKKPKNLREFFKKGDGLKEYIIKGLFSFHNVAEGVIWPIFIYTIFKTVESVAIIPIMAAGTVIIFTYFTSKVKKTNRSQIMTLGAFLISITWILRLIIEGSIFYYVSVLLIGVFAMLVSLPLESNIYEKGEKKDALATSTYQNFFSMFPRILFYGALYLLLEVFQVSFIAAIVGMFIIIAINYIFVIKKPIKDVK